MSADFSAAAAMGRRRRVSGGWPCTSTHPHPTMARVRVLGVLEEPRHERVGDGRRHLAAALRHDARAATRPHTNVATVRAAVVVAPSPPTVVVVVAGLLCCCSGIRSRSSSCGTGSAAGVRGPRSEAGLACPCPCSGARCTSRPRTAAAGRRRLCRLLSRDCPSAAADAAAPPAHPWRPAMRASVATRTAGALLLVVRSSGGGGSDG